MNFFSTNDPAAAGNPHTVPFRQAVFNSLPPDGGLYMPEEIPRMDPLFIRNLPQYTLPEIAFEVGSRLIGDSIPADVLKQIAKEAFDFEVPVRPLDAGMAVLELFHGPSLAFKDFGARFMSRIMGYFADRQDGGLLDVLVATSGDTGGAVALGFLGVPGIRVTILYPKGMVSPVQELQLTTNGQNIRAIKVDGTFDDCQALVKRAFNDPDLQQRLQLTSANSINIARLIPQSFYYFHAYGQLRAQGITELVFSVPSGNFGNIGAGLLAHRMGLPVGRFIAATNANDVVPRYLQTGDYVPAKAVATLSNAMDVGSPSNWARIMHLFGGDRQELKNLLHASAYTDGQTRKAIDTLYNKYSYLACPHTAIAYQAAEDHRQQHPGEYASVFLATAHPCKFPEVYPPELAAKIPIPAQVGALSGRKVEKTALSTDYESFKAFLLG